jgi:hypothetical protein
MVRLVPEVSRGLKCLLIDLARFGFRLEVCVVGFVVESMVCQAAAKKF